MARDWDPKISRPLVKARRLPARVPQRMQHQSLELESLLKSTVICLKTLFLLFFDISLQENKIVDDDDTLNYITTVTICDELVSQESSLCWE